MQFFRRAMRAVLVGAVVLAALTGVPAWAGLTAAQADTLAAKVVSGDKAALETLMAEARQGNPYAQFSAGVLYANGRGVPQDYGQAAQWYRKAAEQGDAAAQSNLGLLYVNGQGVPQDYGQAAQWFRKAAEQGHAGAQFNLGAFYALGQGVPQNNVAAYALANLAAARESAQGNHKAIRASLGAGQGHVPAGDRGRAGVERQDECPRPVAQGAG